MKDHHTALALAAGGQSSGGARRFDHGPRWSDTMTDMLITVLPLLVAIVGLLLYVLASNSKVAEIGRAMLWTGLLVTLWFAAGKPVRLF